MPRHYTYQGAPIGMGDDENPDPASASEIEDSSDTSTGSPDITVAPLQASGGNNQGTENTTPTSSASQGGVSLNAPASSSSGSDNSSITTPATTTASSVTGSGNGLSTGTILLIAAGVAAAGAGVWYLAHRGAAKRKVPTRKSNPVRRHRRKSRRHEETEE